MTPKAQRIAIAEACGWTYDANDCAMTFTQDGDICALPWPSLDAMHEAEKVLDITNGGPTNGDCLRYAYSHALYRLVPEWIQPFRATAAQRAEAFLRTIGKWEESK